MNNTFDFGGRRWLQNMTWVEVDEYLQRGVRSVIIPCGQTEQHGPHLPMGNDTYVAMALAQSVAEMANTLICPPVWLGWAPRLVTIPGSMTLRASTLTHMLIDLCESLMAHGFERFYIINGHRRENLPPMEIACTQVRYRTGALAAVLDPSYFGMEEQVRLSEGNRNIQSHACGTETAHMMYIHRDLVDETRFENSPPELMPGTDHFVLDKDHAIYYDTPEEFRQYRGEEGVRGDVTWATVSRGEALHNAMAKGMAEYIVRSQAMKLQIRKPHPIA